MRPQDAIAFWRFNSVTNYNGVVDSAASGYMMGRDMWIRLTDDGTDHKCQCSEDGNNWSRDAAAWWQAGNTAFLTADYLCFLASSNSSGFNDQVYHFDAIVIEEQ